MRILYCNKYNFRFSGTEAYLFETMDLMRSQGHETALFSMADERGAATPFDQHFVPYTDFKSASGILTKTRLAVRSIYSGDARKRIAHIVDEFKPDVAHVRNIYHHLSPSILWELKSRGVPVVYHLNDFKLICPSYNLVSRGSACERCTGGKFWNVVREGCYAGGAAASVVLAAEAYFHRWLRTYEKCVDLILTPSVFARNKLVENGWEGSRIEVLPHFQSFPSVQSPRPGPNAPILYSGRLSAEKGVEDVLAAIQNLPRVRLVIAGDGPQREELERRARDQQLKNVGFVGHVTGAALQKLIADCQFTVFPSRAYETMGKSILESYVQGRAVIASDMGSRRELVEHGKTGLLYRAGDIDQLSSAIALLCDTPKLAEEMGQNGRQLLRERHLQEQHLSDLENIYARLAAEKKAGPHSSPMQNRNSEPEPVRVAFIGGRGVIGKYSGIESYYEEVGGRLSEIGYEVSAYCRTYFTPPVKEHAGMRIVRFPTIRSKHFETLIHTFLSTIHACFSGCDVVHYHALGPSLFAFVPRLFGKKTVVTVQGLDWQRRKWAGIARLVLRLGEWASARLPNRTIVVSRTLQAYYRARYGNETLYIPNGTRIRQRRAHGYLKSVNLDAGKYLLYLGRFSPEKNCHLLVEAFENIKTPMKLVLAGGSSHADDYAAVLRQHESDRVRILNWVAGDALEELLSNAALFVLPSDMEGMSLALLDAMGAGVCVLASDVPENRETIGNAGFTFKRGDLQELATMLHLLLSNTALRYAAGSRARERVRRNYLWDAVAEETASVYSSLVKGRDRYLLPQATAMKKAA